MTLDISRYKSLFLEESRRMLREAYNFTVHPSFLGQKADPLVLLRCFHTIKGMSATMRLGNITLLSHTLEDVCDAIRKQTLPVAPDTVAILVRGINGLHFQLDQVAEGQDPEINIELEGQIRSFLTSGRTTDFTLLAPTDAGPSFSVTAPDTAGDRAQAGLATIMALCQAPHPSSEARIQLIASAAHTIHEAIMDLRAIQFGAIAAPLRRRVRDLTTANGPSARLEIAGEELRIDPAALAALQGALSHLVSNAMIHGIEPAEVRKELGKDTSGTIRIHATRQDTYIHIQVSDDGRGFDAAALRMVAQKEDGDPVTLAFQPGVSTAPKLDYDAGRGLGLPAVAHTMEVLGGKLSAQSNTGQGTYFNLQAPLRPSLHPICLLETPQGPVAILRESGLASENSLTWETIITPPYFPFSMLPGILGTTFDAEGNVLFVIDPARIHGLASKA